MRETCSVPICRFAPGTRGRSPARPDCKPMSWHPAHEQWGATQMQNRFQRFAKRFMLPLDYQAWVAVRAIGEGATRVRLGRLRAGQRLYPQRRVRARGVQGAEGHVPPLGRPAPPADHHRRSRHCRCRCRRRKAFCMSTPRSTRSASTSRRRSANSNEQQARASTGGHEHARRCARFRNRRGDRLDRRCRRRPPPTPSMCPTRRGTRSR